MTNTRPYSPAIATMIDSFDGGDPWGSATAMAFAVAEVGGAIGALETWSILDYTPGLGAQLSISDDLENESFETRELASAYAGGLVTEDDLIHAAKVLSRYLDLCKRAGRNY